MRIGIQNNADFNAKYFGTKYCPRNERLLLDAHLYVESFSLRTSECAIERGEHMSLRDKQYT